jgi:ribosomal protein S12 methylthiotransferase accessory factor
MKRNKVFRRTFGSEDIPRALLYESPRFFEWQLQYVPTGLTKEILKKKSLSHAPIHCVKGESLKTRRKISIPLQYVLWGPSIKPGMLGADAFLISPKTTSGAGGGFTLADASLSGICELIERDGFMIYWLNRLAPRQIKITLLDSDQFSSSFLEVYRSLSDRGYKVYFLDTTTDVHVPAITCIVVVPFPDGRQGVTISGKCHPHPHRAVELALLEHNAFLSSPQQESSLSPLAPEYMPFADKKMGKSERINLWRSGQMTGQIDFLLSGQEVSFRNWASEFSEPPRDSYTAFKQILGEFSRLEEESGASYEVFRFQAQHRLLDELEYRVVKMVIPALMPLYLVERNAFLDCCRLREVPVKLGYSAAAVDHYNPLPHPFP